jgi:predicted DNA-binding transcriptional regulator YafY
VARGRQVIRLLNLARLVAQPGGVSVCAATRELGCTRRTVYRDLEMLQQVGYPLYSELDDDGATRWRLVDGFRHQHELMFSHEELVALWMARGALSGLEGTVFAAGARSLLEKLSASVPGSVRTRLERSREILAACPASSRYAGRDAVVDAIRRAAEDRYTASLTYESLDRRRAHRLVDPYFLWFDPARAALYFAGWAHDRNAVRTFRMDRVIAATVTGQSFIPIPGWNPQRELVESFAGFQGRAELVRLRFWGRAARLLAEREWHSSQMLRELEGGVIELTMRVPLSPGLTAWVLSWLPEVSVAEPVGLVRAVREAARPVLEQQEEGGTAEHRRRGVRAVSPSVTRRRYRGA